jgi:hypothetical protein
VGGRRGTARQGSNAVSLKSSVIRRLKSARIPRPAGSQFRLLMWLGDSGANRVRHNLIRTGESFPQPSRTAKGRLPRRQHASAWFRAISCCTLVAAGILRPPLAILEAAAPLYEPSHPHRRSQSVRLRGKCKSSVRLHVSINTMCSTRLARNIRLVAAIVAVCVRYEMALVSGPP